MHRPPASLANLCNPSLFFCVSYLEVQIVILVIPVLAPVHDNLLLLLVLRNSAQQLLELVLGDLLAKLPALRQHDQAVLDIGRALLLDEADASQAVCRLRVQDLVQDGLSRLGWSEVSVLVLGCLLSMGLRGGPRGRLGLKLYLLVVCDHINILRAGRKSNSSPVYSPLLLSLFLAAAAAALVACPAALRLELLKSSLSDLKCTMSELSTVM